MGVGRRVYFKCFFFQSTHRFWVRRPQVGHWISMFPNHPKESWCHRSLNCTWLCWVLVVAHGLGFSTACGILVPWPEIEPISSALQGRFLTTGPWEKFTLIRTDTGDHASMSPLRMNSPYIKIWTNPLIFFFFFKSYALERKYMWTGTEGEASPLCAVSQKVGLLQWAQKRVTHRRLPFPLPPPSVTGIGHLWSRPRTNQTHLIWNASAGIEPNPKVSSFQWLALNNVSNSLTKPNA